MIMPFEEFETCYEALAGALDRVGERNERVFLAALCLSLAACVPSVEQVQKCIESALAAMSREDLERID
jgi:hypothetical protein